MNPEKMNEMVESLMRKHFSTHVCKELMHTKWKDGIDVQYVNQDFWNFLSDYRNHILFEDRMDILKRYGYDIEDKMEELKAVHDKVLKHHE